jgi:hypothetical protein
VGLVARHLEDHGIPTVILGSAHDIIEHCGVPRFLFTDFPLGNPCGKPWDEVMQRSIVSMGLELLETAHVPRSTTYTPFRWGDGSEDAVWRRRYLEIDAEMREALGRAGQRRRERQQQARQDGSARSE